MSKHLLVFLAMALLVGCSKEPSEDSSASGSEAEGVISGPFPKTIRGTIGSSYPLEDGTGRIILFLLEYDHAAVIVSSETYDAKGMEEDDVEVSLTIEPVSSDECEAEQCFKGY